jgi:hypothetical protein
MISTQARYEIFYLALTTTGDSTYGFRELGYETAESRIRLRLYERPLQEPGPRIVLGSVLFSRIAA